MAKFIPPGFDADAVLAGLHKAMGFGEPTRTDDKATFFFPKTRTSTPSGASADQDDIPFDVTVPVVAADSHPKATVACAVEYVDATEIVTTAGDVTPSKIVITILDPEWQQVKDFSFVVAGGDKYIRGRVEPPVALGSIDVWTVHCTAEDES